MIVRKRVVPVDASPPTGTRLSTAFLNIDQRTPYPPCPSLPLLIGALQSQVHQQNNHLYSLLDDDKSAQLDACDLMRNVTFAASRTCCICREEIRARSAAAAHSWGIVSRFACHSKSPSKSTGRKKFGRHKSHSQVPHAQFTFHKTRVRIICC